MPPWKPAAGHGGFAGARRLSDDQIALIQQWVDRGAREGDPIEDSAAMTAPAEWELGAPDLVLRMPAPFQLPEDGPDTIRSFVIPSPPGRGRYVKAIEFHPGNARAVHHANIKIDTAGSSRRLDATDVTPGFDGSSRDARFPDGYFLGWTPGQRPQLSDADAWYLPGGADVVVEVHMTPTGRPEHVQVSLGLFLTDVEPARRPFMIRLGSQRIDIPAGATAHTTSDRYVLPVDVELLAVQPHAHNLARSIRGYARLPDGRREWLIDIPDWDFRWQDVYRYATPMRLPRGTQLEMEFTYDNSTGNPRNPHRPPQRVTFGQTSAAEMGDLWMQVATASEIDRATLDADYTPKMLHEDIAGDETMLLTNPRDARLRMDLANCYLAAGRTDDAIAEFKRSLEFDPASLAGHYELAVTLLKAGRLDEADARFRRAIDISPDSAESYNGLGAIALLSGNTGEAIPALERSLQLHESAEAHFNLGRAFAREDRLDRAVDHYRAALALKADDAETHVGLAAALVEREQRAEAVAHYREALRLQPALVSAMTDLAWVLATSRDTSIRQPADAVRLAEDAVRLTSSRNLVVLETLAVSYFEAGRREDAVRTLKTSIERAAADGDQDTAVRLRLRLSQYEDSVRQR